MPPTFNFYRPSQTFTFYASVFQSGIYGKDIKSLIDTRQAGPGELTAHCMGPSKVAFCELYDHRNGTFELNVRPQEPGRHVLQVKYGGEHVPGQSRREREIEREHFP